MLDYLWFVRHVAEDGYAAGIPPVEAARETDLGEFAKLTSANASSPTCTGRTRNCAGVAPAGPRGAGGITEMIEFNSGPIRCFA
jgi:cyclase